MNCLISGFRIRVGRSHRSCRFGLSDGIVYGRVERGSDVLIDYHVHSMGHDDFPSTIETASAFLQVAREKGIAEIGFADHESFYGQRDHCAIAQAAELFPEIGVKIGFEVDFACTPMDDIVRFTEDPELDFIIGSVHHLGPWLFNDTRFLDGYKGKDMDQLYESYYAAMEKAVSTGMIDIVGHLDLIKLFNIAPPKRNPVSYAEGTLRAIREAGSCVEINTSGLYKPVGEVFPSRELLKRCQEYDVPITLGSDAHAPSDVGRDLALALDMARGCGYSKVSTFRKRNRIEIPLGG